MKSVRERETHQLFGLGGWALPAALAGGSRNLQLPPGTALTPTAASTSLELDNHLVQEPSHFCREGTDSVNFLGKKH